MAFILLQIIAHGGHSNKRISFESNHLISICLCAKARRTRAHLSRVLVIRDKLDRQNFLVCACVQLAELKTTWRIKITSSCLVFNSASCTHAQIFLFRRACRLFAAHENFLSRMTKNIKHDENVARTRGNFVDPTCHE